ncbi:long-chain-fatty-acid--CoA ligase [Desulfotomaculum copahuensis]|uniref:Long-chain fatty acid--CoA ligase n=1 Tax=Desulfotomaculum copahuensis TaxID=1838280 RepID=A0A1B7LGA9_9FIRM|nr:long-chain-fatty-acid--CoA ligase [Desulfotomaculum copahuensis]OAT84990.1 long-chain fatty acid--CoA ligase [Desulfotomaculum copahuensis]
MNIGGILAGNARRHPDKECLIYGKLRYTYREFNGYVNRMANAMAGLGVCKGKKVALMMQNSDRYVLVFMAAMKLGAVAVPINFRLAAPEVEYILNHSDSVILFFDPKYGELIASLEGKIPGVRYLVRAGAGEQPQNAMEWDELMAGAAGEEPGVDVNECDDCEILYTSGTTGRPKGALFDHHRVIHVGIAIVVHMAVNPGDRLLHLAPLFHSAQLNLFLVSGMFVGATHVVMRAFEPRAVLETIQDEKITLFFGVPAMYNFMLQVPDFDKYDLSSITRCGYGAAPMPVDLVRRALDRFPTDRFYNLCGLTEGGPGGVLLEPEDQLRKPGFGGKAIINTEARVIDKSGCEVAPGQVGEFIIRSEMVMKGYYKDPGATAETLRDGWLYTGDLAIIDEEGYITLVDRKKDMIITGGENVYSTEVEHVLHRHPGVLEAAVIGLPHPVWGETVTAVICPRPGAGLTTEEIRAFCAQHLADYKIPRIYKFTGPLPRNASGKVLKRILRDIYSEIRRTGK